MEPRQFIAGSPRLPTLQRMSTPRVIAVPCLRALSVVGLALAVGSLATPSFAQAQAQAQAPAAEPAAQELRFDVLEYVIEGNSVLGTAAIEAAVMPHMGPQRSMVDVEAARAALEKIYQGAGYLTVFVDVPEQRVDGGVITLRVLEGRVERL
ncbi:POTRA domain-containing protein, partial [Variovorax sp. YR752]|uniref:POTRA domain-containing protein n=1 Tax=Variovorax sp. YR752 TaxID=1884383 RepID=UPI003137EE63